MKTLKKVVILAIVLLLNCSISYCQNNKVPSTGEDSLVVVSISYIREANEKLIERKYLKEINAQQDSIISDYKLYVTEQELIIKDFQDKLVNANNINEKLNKNLARRKTANIVLGSIAGTAIITTIICICTR